MSLGNGLRLDRSSNCVRLKMIKTSYYIISILEFELTKTVECNAKTLSFPHHCTNVYFDQHMHAFCACVCKVKNEEDCLKIEK